MNAPPEPEYHVPPSSADSQPPSSGQVFRYIVLCLFTVVIVYFTVFIIDLIIEEVSQHGLSRELENVRQDHETPFVLAMVPLAAICLSIVWLDRHTVFKPRRTTSPNGCIGYVVLLGWLIVMLVLGVYATMTV